LSNHKVGSSNKVDGGEDGDEIPGLVGGLVEDISNDESNDDEDNLNLGQYAQKNRTQTGTIFHLKYLTPNRSIT
jgi:hypothetical protein